MSHARIARRIAVALAASLALAAHAGGPLVVCNSAPVKYPGTGTVNLNYDGGGTLGSRTKAQADAIITSAVALWTNVPTATVVIGRGADLPVDVTLGNLSTYFDNYTDGKNPVIYDSDGTITDYLLGSGAHNSVIGFAGSAAYGPPTCQYAEGQAVINGAISISDTTMTVAMAHEIGHLIGMDHTQLDDSQGLSTSNFPLMYPIAYRSSATLGDDDIAAVSALYPDATLNSVYGQVSGQLVLADGVTAVLGGNVWARENTSGKVYSVVSDYLEQGTGFFKLLLPAGTYTLHVEAIQSNFTGGSSVGPYSEAYPTSASFQPPLYTGSTPMTPVTLGNGSPMQLTITPGCVATSTFRLDGNGSIGGNCNVNPASMVSPANGSTLTGSSQTFSWNAAPNAVLYQVFVGNSVGAFDIGYFPTAGTTGTSLTINGLPTDGRTLYVRLNTSIGGSWYARDYTYHAASPPPAVPASIASPADGSTLAGASQTFTWNAATGATLYQVFVGNTVGAFDIGYFPTAGTTGTSLTISGLPTDGRTVHIRLNTAIAGVWYFRDYTYTASGSAPPPPVPAAFTSPVAGSTLAGASQTFTWNAAAGATLYQVFVGNSVGAFDIGYFPTAGTTGTSTPITGLPTDGRTLYIRLYSNIGGTYYFRDFTYTAAGLAAPNPASFTSPAPGSTLTGTSQTFTWNAAPGATLYQVFVGNSVGAYDIGYFPAAGTSGTSTTITGLPTDGRTLYIRLYSNIGGTYYFRDFTYTASGTGGSPPPPPTPAVISSPANGATLHGSTQTFTWNASGASLYQVWVGNSVGADDLGYFPVAGTTGTSTTITGLPTDGRILYVRLYSAINGAYQYRDFSYRSGP